MSATTTKDELEQHLRTAERNGLNGAASLYRDKLAALESKEAADAEDDDSAALESGDPKGSALYAALTGESPPEASPGADDQDVAALARHAEQFGYDGAARYYRRLAAKKGVEVENLTEEEAALADLDEDSRERAEQAEKIGFGGAAKHYRSQE